VIKIHVYELKIGMFVSELEIPWEDSPFLLQGFDLKSQSDIKAIQDVCDYVVIDPARQKLIHGEVSKKNEQLFLHAFKKTATSHEQASALVKGVMDDIRFGNSLNTKAAKEVVSHSVDQVLESPDIMLLFTQLKNQDEYTSQHSLNVCVLSILLAKHLNYSKEELNDIGICGLLHDIGKLKIPLEILNKPDKLTENEARVMCTHTTLGRNILMSARDLYTGAVDVAYTHHEQLDGGGYPRGLKGEYISVYARIVSIVDAYDAITSDRIYKRGRLHLEAIKILMNAKGKHFDASLVLKFIDCIGIYPVGNAVEMKNGEVGVVIAANPKNKTKPKVLMLMNKAKQFCDKFILELDQNPVDSAGEQYRVLKVLPKGEYGLDLYEFNQQGGFDMGLR